MLDALTALDGHLDNLVLVGAQAVYHHSGSADLNVPLMTTDADLAVNTHELADVPEIGGLMRAAGFNPGPNPGHWLAMNGVSVDLMVVPCQAGTTKASARAARIAPHEKLTARIAPGLEPGEARTCDLRVAGPAALLTAKAIKIGERLGQAGRQPDRLKEKDALDVFRVLQAVEVPDLVRGFAKHREDEHAASSTDQALALFHECGTTPQGLLAQLAASASQGDPVVAPSFAALVNDLLTAVNSFSPR
ncbi:hypothetical protein [Saccharopolyspora dendranthemae]|uniref:hypothetical protein n=1 Tax=Saccharopolyspora dendranthemae TaxID=1181886 RepID=UPI001C9519E1|nr:hypothetical protein [Saccharopolyspora dendranthemae]